jgi:hypothetical protein
MVTKPRLRRWTPLLIVLALLLIGLTAGAAQPWTANHFGYALRGDDGLPTYVFMYGRRYQSPQVCAGAGWCLADQQRLHMPRCWTQADLTSRNEWPLSPVGKMFTLFGAPRTLLSVAADSTGVTAPILIADGADCYVAYSLEGGP